MEENEKDCNVRGYQIHKDVWGAIIGEFLVCEREPTNAADRYAVAIRKSGTIVCYLSRKVVKV